MIGSMSDSGNFCSSMFAAKLELLGSVTGFLERCAQQLGMSKDALLRMNLVTEELFVNTVRHGHRGDSESPVWIGLRRMGQALELAFEDMAPAFNPYPCEAARTHSLEAPLEDRPVGGLGLLLTRELSLSQDYAFLYGRNCVRLRMKA